MNKQMNENNKKKQITGFNPLTFLKDFLEFFKTKGNKEGSILNEDSFAENLTRMALLGAFETIKTYADGAKQIIATRGNPMFLTIYMNAMINSMAFAEKLLEKSEGTSKTPDAVEPTPAKPKQEDLFNDSLQEDPDENSVRIDEKAFDFILKIIKKE